MGSPRPQPGLWHSGVGLPGALCTPKLVPVPWGCVEELVSPLPHTSSGCPKDQFGLWFQHCPPSSAAPAPQKLPQVPQGRREALDPLLAKQNTEHDTMAQPRARGGTGPGTGTGLWDQLPALARALQLHSSRGLGGTGCTSHPAPGLECSRVTPRHGDPVPAAAKGVEGGGCHPGYC